MEEKVKNFISSYISFVGEWFSHSIAKETVAKDLELLVSALLVLDIYKHLSKSSFSPINPVCVI